jgi:hypothetical protein
MKRLLIIRSVSFQQLDNNFVYIRKQFPDHEIHILTHEHGRDFCQKYPFVTGVIIYPETGNFDRNEKIPGFEKESYDDVIVPVANLSGVGFANVFAFALSLDAPRVHQCSLAGVIVEMKPNEIRKVLCYSRFCAFTGILFGAGLGLIIVSWFMLLILLSKMSLSRNPEKLRE